MTSKEIIKRIIHHDAPPRIGFDFLGDNPRDIKRISGGRYINPAFHKYKEFGEYPEILEKVLQVAELILFSLISAVAVVSLLLKKLLIWHIFIKFLLFLMRSKQVYL